MPGNHEDHSLDLSTLFGVGKVWTTVIPGLGRQRQGLLRESCGASAGRTHRALDPEKPCIRE